MHYLRRGRKGRRMLRVGEGKGKVQPVEGEGGNPIPPSTCDNLGVPG